jgi:hypothetical protein
VLSVTVEVTSRGTRSTRPVVLGDSDAVKSHVRPTRVNRPQGTNAREIIFSWHSDKVVSYVDLDDFSCPGDIPYVATNDQDAKYGWPISHGVGHQAKIWFTGDKVDYSNLKGVHQTGQKTDPGNPDYTVMTGWQEGTWNHNSVWVAGDVRFQLHVVCQSSDQKGPSAYLDWPYRQYGELMLPWQY